MALVHDDEVEEVAGVFLVEAGTVLVFGDGLIDREIHLAALDDLAVLDLVAGIAEGNEGLVLWVIDEDVAVGEEEDLRRLTGIVGAIPTGLPELPADLEGDDGLAGAGRHRE